MSLNGVVENCQKAPHRQKVCEAMKEEVNRPKDPSVLDLIDIVDPEMRGWVILDHWDTDRCAVGFANRSDPDRLGYLSSWGKLPGHYFLELETPNPDEELGYSAKTISDCEVAEALMLLEEHLR
jgi:hypothetical protein